jgi:hypothetical protein
VAVSRSSGAGFGLVRLPVKTAAGNGGAS